MLPSVSKAKTLATSAKRLPMTSAAFGPMMTPNSGETSVNDPAASVFQMKRAGGPLRSKTKLFGLVSFTAISSSCAMLSATAFVFVSLVVAGFMAASTAMQIRCKAGLSISRAIAPGTELLPARIRRFTIRSLASLASTIRSSSVDAEISRAGKLGLEAITFALASISATCVALSSRPEIIMSGVAFCFSTASKSASMPSGIVRWET